MGLTLLQTKKRISSISSTYKVTSAMKLVSTVKLRKLMNSMENYRYFVNEISTIFSSLFNSIAEIDSPFFNENKGNGTLYILFSSTLGLCGSYNYNIFEILDNQIKDNDYLIIIGNKGKIHYKNFENVINMDLDENNIDSLERALSDYIIHSYEDNKYKEIKIVYTDYKNSITFVPKIDSLLPIKNIDKANDESYASVLIEPSKEEVLNLLVPLYISSLVKERILEAYTSEQASRRNAMENASENAKEIIDELKLEFNKARQSQITNEIIDIVGAATAQKGEK